MLCRSNLGPYCGLLFLILLGSNHVCAGNEEKVPEVEKTTDADVPVRVDSENKKEETTREGRYFKIKPSYVISPADDSIDNQKRSIESDYVFDPDEFQKSIYSDWGIYEIPQNVPLVKPKQKIKTIVEELARDVKFSKNQPEMYTCEFDTFQIHTNAKIDCDSIQNNIQPIKKAKKAKTRSKTRSKSSKGRVRQSQKQRQKLKRQQYMNRKKQPYQRRGYNNRVQHMNRQRIQYQPQYFYSLPSYMRRRTFQQ